jgi:hypothetical protein
MLRVRYSPVSTFPPLSYSNNLDKAVDYFVRFSQQYRRTPLKHELLVSCLNQNKHQQLHRVRNVDTKIHGEASSAVAYITALAEVNQADTLRTYVQSKLTVSHFN